MRSWSTSARRRGMVVESMETRVLFATAQAITTVSPNPLNITQPTASVALRIEGTGFEIGANVQSAPGSAAVTLTAPSGTTINELALATATRWRHGCKKLLAGKIRCANYLRANSDLKRYSPLRSDEAVIFTAFSFGLPSVGAEANQIVE